MPRTAPTASRLALSIALLMFVIPASGCDEGEELLVPTTSGSILGRVTINGGGAAGVTVTLSNGMTATTDGAGGYNFADVPTGAYTVAISGYPSDVSFPATTQAAVVATSGQIVTVNFSGTRIGAPPQTQATVTGTLTCVGGDSSHDPFVFNAGGAGRAATVVVTVTNNTSVTIAGVSGFAPSSLPPLSGTVNATSGVGSASGAGTIAGRGNVSVTASGTLAGGRLEVDLVVGGSGELPGGQPIRYRFVASQ